jgi:hypothetical protein
MHAVRVFSAIALIYGAFFYASNVLGVIHLSDVMTDDEQKRTGITKLSDQQKQELETWLNQKFILKTAEPQPAEITLAENIRGGTQLKFSDGSTYEVSPQDRSRAQFWITPFIIKIEDSGDPNYPVTITNTVTNVSVRAKKIS